MATRAEIAGMMDVMHAAFDPKYGEAWNEQQLVSSLIVPGTRFGLIDSAGVMGPPSPNVRTAGFYLVRQVIDEEELLLIAVDPEYRRSGLASQLMRHLFASATERGTRRVFLEMRADNEAGYFYKNFGFEIVGLRKSYYRGADGKLRDARTLSVSISQIP